MGIIDLDYLLSTLVEGTAPTGESVSQGMYSTPDPTPGALGLLNRDLLASFEGVNGWMGDDNTRDPAGFGPFEKLGTEQIAKRQITRAEPTGATANLDFFSDLFSNGKLPKDVPSDEYFAIPGASITFKNTFPPTAIIFTWQLYAANDGQWELDLDDTERAGLRFFLTQEPDPINQPRDRPIDTQYRVFPASLCADPEAGDPYDQDDYRWARRDRTWSGHYLWLSTDPNADNAPSMNSQRTWFTASIRTWSRCTQLRVRVRNMKYLILK